MRKTEIGSFFGNTILTREMLVVSLITLCGLALRTFSLSSIPLGFFCDEASTGYDAYSLLLTAKDQHGSFLPLFAKSFGDYNEALYRYLTIPSVATFGLNEFAVRLPAAVVGTMTIPIVYMLAKLMFGMRSAGFAALLMAFSPWHIQFSRVAFRAITLPLVFTLAVLFLLLSQRNRPKYLLLSSVFFSLSLLTYASARVFVPLFGIGVCIYLWRTGYLRNHPWYAIVSALLFVSTFLALCVFWISPEGMARSRNVISFDFLTWSKDYLSYFSPSYLFWRGDPNPRHSTYGIGQMHLFEIATVCVGIACCLRERKPNQLLLLTWLTLYALPAALTEPMHALRSLVGIPPLIILSGRGLSAIIGHKPQAETLRRLKTTAIILVVVLSFGFYIKHYFINYPSYSAKAWQYGMREAVDCAKEYPATPVFVGDDLFLAYSFVLFYEQYPPELYHRNPITVQQGRWFYTNEQIGRYHFNAMTNLPVALSSTTDCLIICRPQWAEAIRTLPHTTEIRAIQRPSGDPVLFVFRYRNNVNRLSQPDRAATDSSLLQ